MTLLGDISRLLYRPSDCGNSRSQCHQFCPTLDNLENIIALICHPISPPEKSHHLVERGVPTSRQNTAIIVISTA